MRFTSPRRAWSGDVLDGSRLRPSRPSTSGCHFVRGTPRNTDIGRITEVEKQQALRRGTEGLFSGGESDLGQRLV